MGIRQDVSSTAARIGPDFRVTASKHGPKIACESELVLLSESMTSKLKRRLFPHQPKKCKVDRVEARAGEPCPPAGAGLPAVFAAAGAAAVPAADEAVARPAVLLRQLQRNRQRWQRTRNNTNSRMVGCGTAVVDG